MARPVSVLIMVIASCLAGASQNASQDTGVSPSVAKDETVHHLREYRKHDLLPKVRGHFVSRGFLCGEKGELYVSVGSTIPHMDHFGVLHRLDADGNPVARFSVNSIPGLERAPSHHQFAVGRKGEVVILANAMDADYFVKFTPDGTYDSQIRLGERLTPAHFALFPNGSILAAYRTHIGEKRPMTRIFGPDGRKIADVMLPDDADIQRAVDNHDARYVNGIYPDDTNRAIDWGDAVTGPDGDIYLLRWTSPALVYVINSSGELVRRLEIEAPEFDMHPSHLRVVEGKIALVFSPMDNLNHSVVTISDWKTGARLQAFDAAGLGNQLGCYDPLSDDFQFVTEHSQQAVMHHVRRDETRQ